MTILSITECPACGSDRLSQFLVYDLFPAVIFPVEIEKSRFVEEHSLSSKYCDVCNHIFLNHIDVSFNTTIYDKYYYLYPYENLDTMMDVYRIPFEKAVEQIVDLNKCRSLLEIGTDSALQLQYFIDKGISCTAINPKAKKHDRVTFIDGYYGHYLLDQKYDLIISRFNLEHIIDLQLYMSSIKQNSNENTVVLFQVPNVEFFINNGVLNVLAHEHPQYFNVLSIQHLLRRYGFSLLFCSTQDEPSIICAAKNSKIGNDYPSKYLQEINQLVEAVAVALRQYSGSVVIYGAGLTLTSLLYSYRVLDDMSNITIVDDNPLVHGKCMPGSDKVINSIKDVDMDNAKAVFVLLNKVYHAKVENNLRLNGYKGPIYCMTATSLEKRML